jgi:hypothetical protein
VSVDLGTAIVISAIVIAFILWWNGLAERDNRRWLLERKIQSDRDEDSPLAQLQDFGERAGIIKPKVKIDPDKDPSNPLGGR